MLQHDVRYGRGSLEKSMLLGSDAEWKPLVDLLSAAGLVASSIDPPATTTDATHDNNTNSSNSTNSSTPKKDPTKKRSKSGKKWTASVSVLGSRVDLESASSSIAVLQKELRDKAVLLRPLRGDKWPAIVTALSKPIANIADLIV